MFGSIGNDLSVTPGCVGAGIVILENIKVDQVPFFVGAKNMSDEHRGDREGFQNCPILMHYQNSAIHI